MPKKLNKFKLKSTNNYEFFYFKMPFRQAQRTRESAQLEYDMHHEPFHTVLFNPKLVEYDLLTNMLTPTVYEY